MTDLCLLAAVAGQTIAIPACAVEGVVDVTDVTPVPRTAPHVLGLTAARSKIVTLIDVAAALGEAPLEPAGRAIVAVVDGHRYAFRVDSVDEAMLLPPPIPLAGTLRQGWRKAVIGRVELGETFALLLDLKFLSAPEGFDTA